MPSSSKLNLKALAAELDVSTKTIKRYVKLGCPHSRGGKGRTAPLLFDMAAVVAWMRKVGKTGERGRPAEGTTLAPDEAGSVASATVPLEDGAPLDAASIALLTKQVNLQIKQLEAQKRARVERREEGELVPASWVEACWSGQVEEAKARLNTLPARVAQRVVGMDYDDVYEAIQAEVDEVLRELASWDPGDAPS